MELSLSNEKEEKIQLKGFHAETYLEYREKIGIVSQESHLFSETLRFNITMGLEENDQQFDKFWSWVTSEIPYLHEWGYGQSRF